MTTNTAPSAAPATRATAGLPAYRSEIDGLRALAVLLVIVNHVNAALLPSGFLGVDVFFVISGFVITRSLARRAPMAPGAFLLDFYRRRVQRLVPSLVVCVAITAVLTCLVVPDPVPSLHTGLAALFGLSNLQLHQASTDYFGSDASFNTFTQTWSLGVEEQFYLVYPLLGLLLGFGPGRGQLPRRFQITLLTIGIASLVGFVAANSGGAAGGYLPTHLRLWELAAGCLLVPLEAAVAGRAARTRSARHPLAVAATLALVALPGLAFASAAAIPWTTPAAVLATVVLIAAVRPGTPLQRLLASPVPRHIGLISYPLYLWHWSVLSLARWTVGSEGWRLPLLLILMLAAAEACHRWVETPLRHRAWPGGAGGTVLLGLGVNALTAAGLGLLGPGELGHRLYSGSPTASLTQERRHQEVAGTTIRPDPCLLPRSARPDRRAFAALSDHCSSPPLGTAAAPRRLFVLGDSHAAALIPLENRLHAEGMALTHLSKAGCPFPPAPYGHAETGCDRFQQRSAALVLEQARPGDVVLIAAYHLSHLGDDAQSREELLNARGRPARQAARRRRLYGDGLASFSAEAQRRGLRVILVGAGPRLVNRDHCLDEWFRFGNRMEACEARFRRDLKAARELNRQLRQRLPAGVSFIDPFPWLCPEGCRRDAMRHLLIDDDHLSARAVLNLETPLRALLDPTATPPPARLE